MEKFTLLMQLPVGRVALFFFFFAHLNMQSQHCNGVLPAGIVTTNNPVICKDSTVSAALNTTVQAGATYQWVKNAKWQNVGAANFSAGDAGGTSITVDSAGTPYVVYSDGGDSGKVTVKKYNGTNWIAVGDTGFSAGLAFYTSIAISDSGVIYVAYFDAGNGSRATVMKFDGANWVAVGSPGFTPDAAAGTSIVIDHNGTPYVAYTNYYDTLNVMKYDGSNWNLVGPHGISEGKTYYPSISIAPDNTPYVGYSDDAGAYKPVVKKFNGTDWIQITGTTTISDSCDDVEIAIDDSGKVYLVYGNYSNNFRVNAWKYDGTNWNRLGQPDFSALTEDWLKIALDGSGNPYLAYQDGAYGQKITVKKFDGVNWQDVGYPGFSPDLVYYSSIAFDRNGIPFVAYNDYGSGGKATVMKFDGTPVGTDSNYYVATDTGCYSVRIKNCKGAYSLNTICVAVSDFLAVESGKQDVSCFGAADGSAAVETSGGTAPFTFSWNTVSVQLNDTVSGLTTGTYICTVTDSNMCPAKVTVSITEPLPVDTSVTVSDATLTANSAAAAYQWLDCTNGNSPISGETGSSYTPLANGSYAVIVDEGGCIDTSGCYVITTVGIKNKEKQTGILIYPNPSSGTFIIKANGPGIYKLINETGETVREISFNAGGNSIEISNISNGVYYLLSQTQNNVIADKIVVLNN